MIEIKQPGTRYSAYYNGRNKAGTAVTLNRGMWITPTGFATARLGPASAGGIKYADSGDRLMCVATVLDTSKVPVYPCNSLLFKENDSDLDNDTIASGFEVVYYQGGEYETDQYTGIAANPAFGAYLFLTGNGLLTTGAGITNNSAIAIVIQKSSTFDSNYSATGLLWFRMLEFPVNVSGVGLP